MIFFDFFFFSYFLKKDALWLSLSLSSLQIFALWMNISRVHFHIFENGIFQPAFFEKHAKNNIAA